MYPGSRRAVATIVTTLLLMAGSLSLVTGCSRSTASPPRLLVATTTSLYDTGLWGYLEPVFEEKYGVELDIMYAGTGKALELGRRGDVQVVTVHSKVREEQFIAEGHGVERIPFACNYFLIVGPPNDPAGIRNLTAEDAFRRLANTESGTFVSRGDDSGTHFREQTIWQKAGLNYEEVRRSRGWYVEAGTGMGPTLVMASEKQAYTLTDIGTYLAYKGKLELTPLVPEGDALRNVYSVIAVAPEKMSAAEFDLANKLIDLLTSSEIQALIDDYGVAEYGVALFTPCAGAAPEQDG